MKLRLLSGLSLSLLFLAACSQDAVNPAPGDDLSASGIAADTYVIDFEDAPTSIKEPKLIWNVAVGKGVRYEGEGVAITDKIRVDGYTLNKGKKIGGNSAVVFPIDGEKGENVLFVFPRNEKAQSSQLEIKPSQAFGGPSKGKNGLVTLKGITIYTSGETSGNIVLYGNGKFIKKIPLKLASVQKLELDEPGVGFIQVNARSLLAVDDVVFEVPSRRR